MALVAALFTAAMVLFLIGVGSTGAHAQEQTPKTTVGAWGDNYYGQLGDGTRISRTTPVQVSSLSGGQAVAGGGRHSLALKSDGTVWAWGHNNRGQLGDGTGDGYIYNFSTAPVQVSGLTGVVDMSAGGDHSLALRNDGTLWAWGYNELGQLGDGTDTNRLTLRQVKGPNGEGFLSGVRAIAGGSGHSLAVAEDTLGPTVTVWKPTGKRVSPTANVIATFSEGMGANTLVTDPAALTSTTFVLKKGTTTVAAKVRYDPTTDIATLDPDTRLRRGTTYTATVSSDAQDLVGNPLLAKSWRFTIRR